jgi:hypothetical protein
VGAHCCTFGVEPESQSPRLLEKATVRQCVPSPAVNLVLPSVRYKSPTVLGTICVFEIAAPPNGFADPNVGKRPKRVAIYISAKRVAIYISTESFESRPAYPGPAVPGPALRSRHSLPTPAKPGTRGQGRQEHSEHSEVCRYMPSATGSRVPAAHTRSGRCRATTPIIIWPVSNAKIPRWSLSGTQPESCCTGSLGTDVGRRRLSATTHVPHSMGRGWRVHRSCVRRRADCPRSCSSLTGGACGRWRVRLEHVVPQFKLMSKTQRTVPPRSVHGAAPSRARRSFAAL